MVEIRQAGAADAEALHRVRSASWSEAYARLLPEEMIATATSPGMAGRQRAFLTEDGRRRALLAEDEGEPVGMAVFGPDREWPDRAELYAIYVVPQSLSTGIGGQLLEHAVGQLSASGYRTLSLWVLAANERARRFYERAGFAAVEQRRNERYGHSSDDVRYERSI